MSGASADRAVASGAVSHASGTGARAPWWAPLAGSVGFLTIVPVPHPALNPAALTRSVAFFPLVGLALGAVLGGLGLLLDRVLPAGPTAALLLCAGALVTGGLHLDGVMDTADGLFGGRTREQRLAIMRDSRVGAFGVIAGILVLIGQFATLSTLSGLERLFALMAALTMSRWALLLALGLFRTARPEGLGATYHAAATRVAIVAGTLVAVIVALALGSLGIAAIAATAAITLLGGRWLAQRLGGLTGDTCGALAVLSETAILFLAVALAR